MTTRIAHITVATTRIAAHHRRDVTVS